jgi:hydrogenase maturation protease
MTPRILVAGIGNIFLGDDGFGVEVVRRLAERKLPDSVLVKDYGIRGYDLAYALMDSWELVILVDAVPRGGQPGTVYVIQPEEGKETGTEALPVPDAHTMNPIAVLQMVRLLGGAPGNLLIVGCEPQSVEPDMEEGTMELSPPVRAAVDEAIQVVEELVTNMIATGSPLTNQMSLSAET